MDDKEVLRRNAALVADAKRRAAERWAELTLEEQALSVKLQKQAVSRLQRAEVVGHTKSGRVVMVLPPLDL